MEKQHRSEALASIHETMEALHELDAIDEQTMRDFDEACLAPVGRPGRKAVRGRIHPPARALPPE